jgi:hypothetical protein
MSEEPQTGPKIGFLGPLVNSLLRRIGPSEAFLRAWIVHNIEESGETEKFVPELFDHAKVSRKVA